MAATGTQAPSSPHGESAFIGWQVDDEAAFARAIRELLTLQGHQVTVVDSAAKALDAVATSSFDVVLTDYSLGTVTGGAGHRLVCSVASVLFRSLFPLSR